MIEKNWNDMIKPSNVVITAKGGDVKGTVVAEPIEKGYGLTIGNSLRRVLLSSLQGAAITAIKIIMSCMSFQVFLEFVKMW